MIIKLIARLEVSHTFALFVPLGVVTLMGWIEWIVLDYVIKLIQNADLLEHIAENTYQYYLAQNTDTSYTKSLQKALSDTEKSIGNLLKAIEAGILNESTKARMDGTGIAKRRTTRSPGLSKAKRRS